MRWVEGTEYGFDVLVGKTLTAIEVSEDRESITFKADDGSEFLMYHEEDCCETVLVEDIAGDLEDMIGAPITMAEEVTSSGEGVPDPKPSGGCDDSWTWTFYTLGTNKGRVVIRWFGTSNGYYSESVGFIQPGKAGKK